MTRPKAKPSLRKSCDYCVKQHRGCHMSDGQEACNQCRKRGIDCHFSERRKSGPKPRSYSASGRVGRNHSRLEGREESEGSAASYSEEDAMLTDQEEQPGAEGHGDSEVDSELEQHVMMLLRRSGQEKGSLPAFSSLCATSDILLKPLVEDGRDAHGINGKESMHVVASGPEDPASLAFRRYNTRCNTGGATSSSRAPITLDA